MVIFYFVKFDLEDFYCPNLKLTKLNCAKRILCIYENGFETQNPYC